jgi:Protein of unknown function DUF262
MQKPDRSSFTTLDFLGWEEAGTLSLSPKFQRRAVWKLPARAYLVDALLKGLPVPPIYLRVTPNERKTRTMREVIDGQQHLRAVLDFVKDDYALTRSVSDEAPGSGSPLCLAISRTPSESTASSASPSRASRIKRCSRSSRG